MLEQPLWAVLEERGNEYGWEVDSRTVTIRSQHTRAKRQKQSLSDFDHASWELINNLSLAESDRWGPQDIDVAIEIVGHSTIKRPRRGVADAPTTIPNDATGATGARTRTDRLLDQQEARRQQAREEGNYDLDIIDRWQCHDPDCPNENGFCFVDYSDKHYTITASQSQLWSKAMATGEPGVTVLRPPTRLYNLWKNGSGEVTSTSKRQGLYDARLANQQEQDELASMMSEMMKMSRFQMQMSMNRMMREDMERQHHQPAPAPHSYVTQSMAAPPYPQPQLPAYNYQPVGGLYGGVYPPAPIFPPNMVAPNIAAPGFAGGAIPAFAPPPPHGYPYPTPGYASTMPTAATTGHQIPVSSGGGGGVVAAPSPTAVPGSAPIPAPTNAPNHSLPGVANVAPNHTTTPAPHQRSGPQPPPHRPRRPPGYRTPTPPTPESIGEFSQESEGPESYGGGNGEVSSEL
ncbi:hypothetical protein MMC28_009663 [Mycoblastus sanguinarius]|nr:hypothetical protein [Mycoblastus sanguinarius]